MSKRRYIAGRGVLRGLSSVGQSVFDIEDWEAGGNVIPYPNVYADTPAVASHDPWYAQFVDLAKQALTLQQMRELQRLNLERARQGLPPIDTSRYAPQVNVGVAPDTQRLLLIGGGLLLAALLLPALLKR
jgi:hypothetical protein